MGLSMRWREVAGTGAVGDRWWDRLRSGYGEAHRRYHSLRHLDRVTADVEWLLGEIRPSRVADADALRLAAWFHDVVYDPAAGGGANEEASALEAEQCASELGWTTDRARFAGSLVRATVGHETDTAEGSVLLDADLAVLGAGPDDYRRYVDGVRHEYSHVPDDAWVVGRTAVLRSFLERPAIYRTAPMRDREDQARANLADELADLGGRGARLRP